MVNVYIYSYIFLYIHEYKQLYKIRRTRRISDILTIQDHDIEIVKGFKCLGTVKNNTDYEILEIKTIILAANNTYSSL